MAETILTGGGFAGNLINNSIVWEDGFILAPSEPGLGIEFNEELARSNPYKENRLHLQMQDEPCDYKNGNSFTGGSSD